MLVSLQCQMRDIMQRRGTTFNGNLTHGINHLAFRRLNRRLMFNKNSLIMKGHLFAGYCADLVNGFDSVVIFSQRVDKFNVTVTYSDVRIWDDDINCRRVPPYLIKVHTLGRYPQLVKSERFSTFKDCLKWLVTEYAQKY